MSAWTIANLMYVSLVIVTAIPLLLVIVRRVPLHPGGASFEESNTFSEEGKARLTQHYSRMAGTLGFWKKQATIYRNLHYYTLCWTIPSSVAIPFLIQAITTDPASRWLATIVSGFTAVQLAFHRALKVDANYKAFRQGESDFYDTYRRLLDRPASFGKTEADQIDAYFDAVENLRKYIRNAEIDNLPSVEQVKEQLQTEKILRTPRE
jgi:hypothetical protein